MRSKGAQADVDHDHHTQLNQSATKNNLGFSSTASILAAEQCSVDIHTDSCVIEVGFDSDESERIVLACVVNPSKTIS